MNTLRNRFGKFLAPVSVGETYRILGYHTGEFIGECEFVDRDLARFRVLDPLRRAPRVAQKCPYPACVLRDFHVGDHELTSVRDGALIEVRWQFASFAPVAEVAA
jgi:hypothetical protein